MSARLGPEWRAFVEAVREDAAARRDLANTDTAVGATEVYAANDVVHAAAVLLAAEGSRDMRESHPVAPGGADTGTHDGGLASPAHVPASPAPADPAGEEEMDTIMWELASKLGYDDDNPRFLIATERIHAEVQRREAAAMESLRRDIASAMDNEVMVGNTAVDVRCVALAVVDRYLRSQPHD